MFKNKHSTLFLYEIKYMFKSKKKDLRSIHIVGKKILVYNSYFTVP